VDRYDPELGGIGLADAFAGTVDEVAHLLGDAFENAPPRRSRSYAATVLTDLAAVIPGGGSLYGDLVNDFLAVDASPEITRADEKRAQWRPDGPGATFTPHVRYAEPLPPDGAAASHHADPAPPVPTWEALALASTARNRHVTSVLRASLAYPAPSSA
jgi:hypothetical protein